MNIQKLSISVNGKALCGKTTFCMNFVTEKKSSISSDSSQINFQDLSPLDDSSFGKFMTVEDIPCFIKLFEAVGAGDFNSASLRKMNGLIFMYSVDDLAAIVSRTTQTA